MSSFDVITFGDYYCDLIITGLPDIPRLGRDMFGQDFEMTVGGLFINTTSLHRLGVRVGWVTDLGNDLFSNYVLSMVRKEGLDESLFRHHDFPVRRLSLSFSFQHDRGFISYVDRYEPELPFEQVHAHRPRAVMMSHLPIDQEGHDFISTVHQHGGLVYLDSQYSEDTLETPAMLKSLAMTDIFTLNRSEALALTARQDVEEALDALAQHCPLVVIKCGADGAIAQQGSRRVSMPGLSVDVVDTTGAGDCFNAGFLAAHLDDLPLETCLQYGNICGGLSTTAHGGTAKAPTRAEIQAWLEKTYSVKREIL
jgi:sugar/nucleoside kinase (ribokinase family)